MAITRLHSIETPHREITGFKNVIKLCSTNVWSKDY